ncbi:MAG: hypothetical protein HY894_06155 [Deltaproteobacteria bacterium]|nr:hypothetical protein [Deltaproteobacteria bacterium]
MAAVALHKRLVISLAAVAAASALLVLPIGSEAGVPAVSGLSVTDVTPSSFTVVWLSSEPSAPSISMFMADCATPVYGAFTSARSGDSTGNLRVTVSNLSPNTLYCYQTVTTSKSTSESALLPAAPATVTTEKAAYQMTTTAGVTTPFANSLLAVPPVYQKDANASTDGVAVTLTVLDNKASHPLSTLTSGGSGAAYFNLNNLYDPATGYSLNLTGGERVMLAESHGLDGCAVEHFYKLVPDAEKIDVQTPVTCALMQDLDCSGEVNILDVLREVKWNATARGGACFNGDSDMNGDGSVDQTDVFNVSGSFGMK